MKTNKLMILFLLFLSPPLMAHPTSFQGAWSLMNESTTDTRHTMLTYSHRYWLASAAHYVRMENPEEQNTFEMGGVGLNALIKRWNLPKSQGNFYISAAGGREFTQGLSERNVAKLAIDLDWEDRDYYIALGHRQYFRQDFDDIDVKKLRLGFSPYLGEFDELNTWFIVEAMQMNQETIEVTPMFRFYYRNVLWEVGSSLRGNWMFNFMVHMF